MVNDANTKAPSFGSSSGQPGFVFGSTQNESKDSNGARSAFGKPAFGFSSSTAAPAFGALSNTAAPAFGSPAFGSAVTSEKSAFGKPAFGSTDATNKPAFGSPSFGSTNASDKPAFSKPTFGSAAFGSTSTSETSSFGKPAFGSATTLSAPAFGSTTTTSAPAFGTPAFGSASTSEKSAFGKTAFDLSNKDSTPSFGESNKTAAPSFGTPSFTSTESSKPTFGAPSFGSSSFGSAATTAATFGSLKTDNQNTTNSDSNNKFSFGNLKLSDSPFTIGGKNDSPFASISQGTSPFANIAKGPSPFGKLNDSKPSSTETEKADNLESKPKDIKDKEDTVTSENDEDDVTSPQEESSEKTASNGGTIETLMDRIKQSANIQPDKISVSHLTTAPEGNSGKSESPFSSFTDTIKKPSSTLGSFSINDNPAFSFSSTKKAEAAAEIPTDDEEEIALEQEDEEALGNLTINDKESDASSASVAHVGEDQLKDVEKTPESDLEVIEKTKSMEDLECNSNDSEEAESEISNDVNEDKDIESDNDTANDSSKVELEKDGCGIDIEEKAEEVPLQSDNDELEKDELNNDEESIPEEEQDEEEQDEDEQDEDEHDDQDKDIESFEDLTGVLDEKGELDVPEETSTDAETTTQEENSVSVSSGVQTDAADYVEQSTQPITSVDIEVQTEAVDLCDFQVQAFEGSESYLAEEYKPKPLPKYYTNAKIDSIPSMATTPIMRSMEKTYHMIEAELSVLNDNIKNLDGFFKDQCTVELNERTVESLPNIYTWRLSEATRLQTIVEDLTPEYEKNGHDLDTLSEDLSDFTMKVLKSHSEMDELKEFIYQVEYLINTSLDNKHRNLSLHQSKMQGKLRQKMSKINDELQCINKSVDVLKMYASENNAVERAVLVERLVESKAKHEELLEHLQRLHQQSEELQKLKTSDPEGDSYDIAREEITSMEIVDLGMQLNTKREIGALFKQLNQ